jgi:hypothetical protein
MYAIGAGVPANNVLAHMWWNISAANGEDSVRSLRDALAEHMTLEDISEAQKRARVCMESDYQECD